MTRYNGVARSYAVPSLAKELKILRVMLSTPKPTPTPDVLDYLPNTVSLSFVHILAPNLLAALAPRLAVSAGSACHSGGGGGDK
ncbi:hypothetical protein EON65_27370, partial [archaeon]